MEYRHHTMIEKKPVTAIHKKVKRSRSSQSTIDKHHQDNGRHPSVQNVSVVPIPKKFHKKKRKSIDVDRTEVKRCDPALFESANNDKRNAGIEKSLRPQSPVGLCKSLPKPSTKNQIQKITENKSEETKHNHNDFAKTNVRNIEIDSIIQHTRKYKWKRLRKAGGYNCCSCSRLCITALTFASLLLAFGIAATIVALLTKTTETTTNPTTITTTTVTTTTVTLSIGPNDILQGLWNTVAGGNSTIATPGTGVGNYIANEGPPNAFDGNCSRKFLSFGQCYNNGPKTLECATNTGFHVTLFNGAVSMKSLRFCTANDQANRDPKTITLEGTNQTGSTLLHGSSWTLIYNGSCGLDVDPGRNQYGQLVTFSYNSIAYSSYRILVESKRGSEYCTQYGELQLFQF